jgi:hypothetical protein
VAAVQRHRCAHRLQREVVEHDDIDLRRQALAHLLEILGLDFHAHAGRVAARCRNRCGNPDPAAAMWFSLISTMSCSPRR